MLVNLNEVPENFDPERRRISNHGFLQISHDVLRDAGLRITDGLDELGTYEQAEATVDTVLVILHRYTDPEMSSFSIEVSENDDIVGPDTYKCVAELLFQLHIGPSVWTPTPAPRPVQVASPDLLVQRQSPYPGFVPHRRAKKVTITSKDVYRENAPSLDDYLQRANELQAVAESMHNP